jgi:hypothetical protein
MAGKSLVRTDPPVGLLSMTGPGSISPFSDLPPYVYLVSYALLALLPLARIDRVLHAHVQFGRRPRVAIRSEPLKGI